MRTASFGTDMVFAAVPGVQANIAALAATELLTDEEKRRVVRDNAVKLLPRLR
jgi:predicted TIM-barrel fold metal-dependent hydrolase